MNVCVCCTKRIPNDAKAQICPECNSACIVDQHTPNLICNIHHRIVDPKKVTT